MTAAQRGWLLPPLALFLAAGILLGRAAGSWLYGALGCVLALAGCLMLRGMGRFCACLALALCLGCLRGYFAFHPSLPEEGGYRITGVVCAEVESRSSGQIRTVLTHVELDGVPLAGNAYWTFYADAAPADLLPGRFVAFLGSVYHPSGPSNPDGYDFREELLRQGIRTGIYGSRDLAVDKPGFFSLCYCYFKSGYRKRIFSTDVDIAFLCSYRVSSDQHALYHLVRIAFHDASVHERTGIAFISVTYHIPDLFILAGNLFPFVSGLETAASPAS